MVTCTWGRGGVERGGRLQNFSSAGDRVLGVKGEMKRNKINGRIFITIERSTEFLFF